MKIDIDPNMIRTATLPVSADRPPYIIEDKSRTFHKLRKILWEHFQSRSSSLRIFKVNVSTIIGREKHSGLPLKTIYFGETEEECPIQIGKIYSRPELARKCSDYGFAMNSIYSDFEIIEQEKNVNAFNIERRIKKYEKYADLIITHVEPFFSPSIKKSPYLIIPTAVSQKLHLADTWDRVMETFSKEVKKELRRILKREYRYFVSHSQVHFKQFYYEMYLPYTKMRFGENAVPNMTKAIQRGLSNGAEILFLLQNDRVLLGSLHNYDQDQMTGSISATADNLTPQMINGAFTAMFYFAIMTAFEEDVESLILRVVAPYSRMGPLEIKENGVQKLINFSFSLMISILNFVSLALVS